MLFFFQGKQMHSNEVMSKFAYFFQIISNQTSQKWTYNIIVTPVFSYNLLKNILKNKIYAKMLKSTSSFVQSFQLISSSAQLVETTPY